MSEMSGWVNMAIKFYFIMALIYGSLLGGCVYGCYKITGHGVHVTAVIK